MDTNTNGNKGYLISIVMVAVLEACFSATTLL